ncbi:MAG: V-type ATP synthase subunit D [Bacteroidetes bacterium]|nr:V-type ATP synthase subunit D [Bacteroidota bacterium]MBK8682374.1 V-type ATP synthase subunit D [Bacteroidota bacterium]
MALKFQYNKIALQEIERAVKIRAAALPTIRSKESALRFEIKKLGVTLENEKQLLADELDKLKPFETMWKEWDKDLISVTNIITHKQKFAGVAFPVLTKVEFEIKSFSPLAYPLWLLEGVQLMQMLVHKKINLDVLQQQMDILISERKKTTQKLNLYEKVQIPELEEAKRKIKRYMEDEDNLAKSSQKLLKNKMEQEA